jgi:hypothetical protein
VQKPTQRSLKAMAVKPHAIPALTPLWLLSKGGLHRGAPPSRQSILGVVPAVVSAQLA